MQPLICARIKPFEQTVQLRDGLSHGLMSVFWSDRHPFGQQGHRIGPKTQPL